MWVLRSNLETQGTASLGHFLTTGGLKDFPLKDFSMVFSVCEFQMFVVTVTTALKIRMI